MAAPVSPYVRVHLKRDGFWRTALISLVDLLGENDETIEYYEDPEAPEDDVGAAAAPAWGDITDKPATFAPVIGAGAGDAVAGNDARLTDARTPTAHNHDATYEPKNANIQAHIAAAHAPANAQKNSDITQAEIEAKLTGEVSSHTHPAGAGGLTAAQVIALIYPVGSILYSEDDENPGVRFADTTWELHGAGRVAVCIDAADQDFDTAGETRGAKTHTLTTGEMPAHTHTQDPHSHTYASQTATTGGASSYEHGAIDASSTAAESSISTNPATATNQNTGGGGAHNNIQPSIVVYRWKRTA